jgi:chromosome segregation ATPase
VEHYVHQLNTLDEALQRTRGERDQAVKDADAANEELADVRQSYAMLQYNYNQAQHTVESQQIQIQELRHNNDDANREVQRLTDELELLKRKSEEFKAHVEGLWKLFPQPRNEEGQFSEYPKAQGF